MSTSRRPGLLWRTFVLTGVGTATAVTVSDAAWERWQGVFGDAIPRDAFRGILAGTAGLHAVEASAALVSAKRGGLEKPGRWALSTLIWGFPVLRRLRKAKKAGGAPVTTKATAPTKATKATTPTKPTKPEKKAAKKAAKRAAVAAAAAGAAAAKRSLEQQAA